MKNIRWSVLLVPMILLLVASALSLIKPEYFLESMTNLNQWLLNNFSLSFSITALCMFLICTALYISPVSKNKIGGENSEKLLSPLSYFAVVLCTTVAVGILFWGCAEPLYHLQSPPSSFGITPLSIQAETLSLSILYLHWTLTPYAIYTLPAIVFAYAYYNSGFSFSLSSLIKPIYSKIPQVGESLIDSICLFALCAGMAASLGSGLLSLKGGLERFLPAATPSYLILGGLSFFIVSSFLVSSISGLQKGIKKLSGINTLLFFIFCFWILVNYANGEWLFKTWKSISFYVSNFFNLSILKESWPQPSSWTKSWSSFYWANWMAWAPITALFLGYISRGYTLREVLRYTWIYTSLFGFFWMSIFSGSTLSLFRNDGHLLIDQLKTKGPESIAFSLFESVPGASFLIPLFILTIFISYVTAADSNITAISNLCQNSSKKEDNNATSSNTSTTFLKIVWGVLIGFIAFTMVNASGIEGIKTLSNLGGLPALALMIGVCISAIKLIFSKPEKLA